MRKILLIGGFVLTVLTTKAQQQAMVTQYMFTGQYINPAYVGSHPYNSFSLLHRNQWMGFEGAPKTSMVTYDGVTKGEKVGLGGILLSDNIGVTSKLQALSSYSYKLKLGPGHLNFGLSAGISSYRSNFGALNYWDPDQVFTNPQKSSITPTFGFGSYFYTKKGYVGFSIPTIYAMDNFSRNMNYPAFARHYYLTAGTVFNVSEAVKFKPSFLLKYVNGAPLEADLSANFLLKEMLWVGVAYRTRDAFTGLMEYQLNKQLRLGYSFDYTTSIMSNYARGTHEIMLAVDLVKNEVKIKNPRFF
jgi:type IX secretion system PorP/SprF family membrane protein